MIAGLWQTMRKAGHTILWEIDMHDSGERQTFETGAVRDSGDKSRPDLISPYAQMRKGEWLRQGAKKYDERNWEKGMKFGRCIASIFRHLFQYMMGWTNEDHLAAIAVNAEFLMHYEKMIELGKLSASLNDLPQYEKKFICPEGWVIEFDEASSFFPVSGWWIHNNDKSYYYMCLWKDGQLHQGTGWYRHKTGEAPGYWPTKQEAEVALAAYLGKQSATGYCEHCEGKIRRARNGEAVGLCRECSKL